LITILYIDFRPFSYLLQLVDVFIPILIRDAVPYRRSFSIPSRFFSLYHPRDAFLIICSPSYEHNSTRSPTKRTYIYMYLPISSPTISEPSQYPPRLRKPRLTLPKIRPIPQLLLLNLLLALRILPFSPPTSPSCPAVLLLQRRRRDALQLHEDVEEAREVLFCFER
jgi:hypothetical protein